VLCKFKLFGKITDTNNKLLRGNNFIHWKTLDLVLDLNYFSLSNPDPNPNPTHLPKHQVLSPKHQFSQGIWYVEYFFAHVPMAWSHKFRLTPALSDTVCGEQAVEKKLIFKCSFKFPVFVFRISSLQNLEMWFWSEQTGKMYTQNLYQIQGSKLPLCLTRNQLFYHIFVGGGHLSASHLPTHPTPFPPTPVRSPLNKWQRWHSTAGYQILLVH